MINDPFNIAREAIMLRCNFTMEDVNQPKNINNPFMPGKILKIFNADLAKQINAFRKTKTLTKAEIIEGCESEAFRRVFLEKDEDKLLDLIDACELTKYKTIESLFKLSERFEKKTLDAFAVFSGYLGWADMDFNERFSYKEVIESAANSKEINSISMEEQELKYGIKELKKIALEIKQKTSWITSKELTVNVPSIRIDQIVGRKTDILDLHKRLFDSKQTILITGIGGIGKTTLGAVYATEYSNLYKHIVWINQISGDFVIDLVNTPGLLESLNISKKDKTQEDLYFETIMALKSVNDNPCLMIIDNANIGLSQVIDSIPNQPNWHIIVTSRDIIPNLDLLELGILSKEDAVKLFKTNYSYSSLSDKSIDDVLNQIDYHTLSIEILAKTASYNRIQIDNLMEILEKDLDSDIIVRHSANRIEKVTSYLSSILKINQLVDYEKRLLINLSCLPPEFHTFDRIIEYTQPEESEINEFSTTLNALTKKGWLFYDKFHDRYKLHRIIIKVIANSFTFDINQIQPLVSYVISKLSYETGIDDLTDKIEFISFGRSLLSQFHGDKSQQIGTLQNDLAIVLMYLNGYQNLQEAKSLLTNSIESAIENNGTNHHITATRYSNLATVYKFLDGKDNLIKAKDLYKKSICNQEKSEKENDPALGVSYSNLATVLQEIGGKVNLLEAIEYLRKSIKIAISNFGELDPITSSSYSNLAIIYQELGGRENLLKAQDLLKKAVASDIITLGSFHPDVGITLSNLATVFQDLGEYKESKELLLRAKDIAEQKLGELHPDTAMYYNNLAFLLHDQGGKCNLQEAIIWINKSIQIEENIFNDQRPVLGKRYAELASILIDLGGKQNLFDAKDLLVRAKNILEKTRGKEHSETSTIINNLLFVNNKIENSNNLA